MAPDGFRPTIIGMDTITDSRTANSGFTIIELVVVVAVLGTIMAMVLVGVTAGRDRGEHQQAEQAAQTVLLAQQRFAADHGVYTPVPSDLDLPDGPQVHIGPVGQLRATSVAVGTDGTLTVAAATGRDNGCVWLQTSAPWQPATVTRWDDPDVPCDARLGFAAPASAIPPVSPRPSTAGSP